HLAAQGIEISKAEPGSALGKIQVSGHVWHPISVPGQDDLQNLQVAVPVQGEIARGKKGEFKPVMPLSPSPENISEATHFVRSLATQGQIAGRPGAFRATHDIETDAEGNRKLKRRGFSAV